MDGWHLVLYAIPALLAVQSLVRLMANHKRQFTRKLMAEEEARRIAAGFKPKKEDNEEQDEQADQAAA